MQTKKSFFWKKERRRRSGESGERAEKERERVVRKRKEVEAEKRSSGAHERESKLFGVPSLFFFSAIISTEAGARHSPPAVVSLSLPFGYRCCRGSRSRLRGKKTDVVVAVSFLSSLFFLSSRKEQRSLLYFFLSFSLSISRFSSLLSCLEQEQEQPRKGLLESTPENAKEKLHLNSTPMPNPPPPPSSSPRAAAVAPPTRSSRPTNEDDVAPLLHSKFGRLIVFPLALKQQNRNTDQAKK